MIFFLGEVEQDCTCHELVEHREDILLEHCSERLDHDYYSEIHHHQIIINPRCFLRNLNWSSMRKGKVDPSSIQVSLPIWNSEPHLP